MSFSIIMDQSFGTQVSQTKVSPWSRFVSVGGWHRDLVVFPSEAEHCVRSVRSFPYPMREPNSILVQRHESIRSSLSHRSYSRRCSFTYNSRTSPLPWPRPSCLSVSQACKSCLSKEIARSIFSARLNAGAMVSCPKHGWLQPVYYEIPYTEFYCHSYDTQMALGLVRAAERARSPAILQLFPVTLAYGKGPFLRFCLEM